MWSNAQVREEERRSLVQRLEREARQIRLTLAGSAVPLLLLARVALRMGLLWLAVLAAAGGALYWARLLRRLRAIRHDLRARGLRSEAVEDEAGAVISPFKFFLILFTVLASVGVCLALFLWLAEKLK